MKTFDKKGNVTKAAQKARYPKYIAYVDGRVTDNFTKAMIETDLLAAMKTLEAAALKGKEDVSLIGIYEKQAETSDIGEPLYKRVIGARMGERGLNGWHFWDEAHGENCHGLNKWYSRDFARDDIQEWDRRGSLLHERDC